MAYIYESTQTGVVKFTDPTTNKTVTLFKGSRVTVDQKLAGGYLRVLTLVGETKEAEVATKQNAKVADKITKVEEVVTPVTEVVEAKVEDAVSAVKEEEVVVETPVAEEVAPVAETPAEAPLVEVTTPTQTKKSGKKR